MPRAKKATVTLAEQKSTLTLREEIEAIRDRRHGCYHEEEA